MTGTERGLRRSMALKCLERVAGTLEMRRGADGLGRATQAQPVPGGPYWGALERLCSWRGNTGPKGSACCHVEVTARHVRLVRASDTLADLPLFGRKGPAFSPALDSAPLAELAAETGAVMRAVWCAEALPDSFACPPPEPETRAMRELRERREALAAMGG